MSGFNLDKGEVMATGGFEEEHTRIHNRIEFVTYQWAMRHHDVCYVTVCRWVRECGLKTYKPPRSGRRLWLRRDEVEAFTPPQNHRGPARDPEVRKTALRADLTLSEAALLTGLSLTQVNGIRKYERRTP